MSEPVIRLKGNLFHEVRNQDADVSEIETAVQTRAEHRLSEDVVRDVDVKNVRISVGYEASALFLYLSGDRWYSDETFDRLLFGLEQTLEYANYADNIRVTDWKMRPETFNYSDDQ